MITKSLLRIGACALAFCTVGPAFQISADSSVNIVPRARPSADVHPATLRVDASLVLIPARVTNPLGLPVIGLTRDAFHVFENGVEQTITDFAQDNAPISIGVLFDKSGSMKNKAQKAAQSLSSFFYTANAEDEFFLVEFNERARVTVPFTRDPGVITDQILRTRPSGMTCLLDAMKLALAQIKKGHHQRKAIVIISDGGENWSRHNFVEIRNGLQEAGVQVYAMGIFDTNVTTKHPAEERNGPDLLDRLAAETGGRQFPVHNLDELPAISARISRELRSQYVLGYSPGDPTRDGKYRRVKLTLALPDAGQLHVDYRQGYFAPPE